ncbi:MAG: DNA alkylation repair protein [Anaerolineaceae bacterium]|nr:DNA alkylation repair protein [Anaerolineaceae bacterium]
MAPVQLERLRPQINAVASLFEKYDLFIKSLVSLLESYSSEINISPSQISPYSLIQKLNVPQVVLNQLEVSFSHLTPIYPTQAKKIADHLWKKEYFEYKEIALLISSNLPPDEINWFFNKIEQWINKDTETPIVDIVLGIMKKNEDLITNNKWFFLIKKWIYSKNNHLKKIGLFALSDLIALNSYQNLPAVFHLIEPIISKPNVSINSNLIKVIKTLVDKSESETAAFIIHLATLYPTPELLLFIRKCLPFFRDFNSSEIKKRLLK